MKYYNEGGEIKQDSDNAEILAVLKEIRDELKSLQGVVSVVQIKVTEK